MATAHHSDEKKHHHVFLWIFLAIQVVMLIWLVTGIHAGASSSTTGLNAHEGTTAHEVGTSIGAGIIILVWALVDIIVGGTYAVYRLATRKR